MSDAHAQITSYFLKEIQQQGPDSRDANVQIGLGLLFYSIQDYEKTIDCFRAAVSLRPDDYLLWNRLGATLSNSGNSRRDCALTALDEAAIEAYDKALQLKPNFVRGRYNLGVSCMNIGCFKEAAEHFLSALSMHAEPFGGDNSSQVNISRTLWDTLNRTFLMVGAAVFMCRWIEEIWPIWRGRSRTSMHLEANLSFNTVHVVPLLGLVFLEWL